MPNRAFDGIPSALLALALLSVAHGVATADGADAEPIAEAPASLTGLLFAGRWEFAEPVEFVAHDGKRLVGAGHYVALAVDPAAFAPRGAPQPLILADGTACIGRGGPFRAGDGDWFVVVQTPELDLTTAGFWVGPRLLHEGLTVEQVARLWESASASAKEAGFLSPQGVAEASRRVPADPVRTPAEVLATAVAFLEQARREPVARIPFEGPRDR